MNSKLINLLIFIIGSVAGIVAWVYILPLINSNNSKTPPITVVNPTPLPLNKYTYNNLTNYQPKPSIIKLNPFPSPKPNINLTTSKAITPEFESYVFKYQTLGKTMSGAINVPTVATPSAGFPTILMLRGFVPLENYTTGTGTKNGAAALAKAGYVTIAPDFLGYGESDPPAVDTFEARFEKIPQILDLLSSMASLNFVNRQAVGLWGHSNGGNLALSVLATGQNLPTVLWAPVSKGFPFSILAYTDETDDGGIALRKVLSIFEKDYNALDFSVDKYFNRIIAPIQLHQGAADVEVPYFWSRDLVSQFKTLKNPIDYHEYPGTDHNLRPSWDQVMRQTIEFYQTHLK